MQGQQRLRSMRTSVHPIKHFAYHQVSWLISLFASQTLLKTSSSHDMTDLIQEYSTGSNMLHTHSLPINKETTNQPESVKYNQSFSDFTCHFCNMRQFDSEWVPTMFFSIKIWNILPNWCSSSLELWQSFSSNSPLRSCLNKYIPLRL